MDNQSINQSINQYIERRMAVATIITERIVGIARSSHINLNTINQSIKNPIKESTVMTIIIESNIGITREPLHNQSINKLIKL